MPFCPDCRCEYRPGFDRCADCGTVLVDALPSAPAAAQEMDASPDEEPDTVVTHVSGQPMAEMYAELLAGQGIEYRLVPLPSSALMGLAASGADYELLVPSADVHRVRSILRLEPVTEEQMLDEVDRAIARGDLDQAEDLLESVEEDGKE
jgi:hypothetical protein